MKSIVVCGATGKQGGAVLEALTQIEKFKIIALSRNPSGETASALKERGIEVRKADLQDKSSLVKAFQGADYVYGVTTPETPKGKIDTRMEREQGINLVDACVENNIKHLVLSTVWYISDEQLAIPYVKSKQDIESYLGKSKIPYTLLRPASFMDELGGPYLDIKKNKVIGMADDDAKLPYIACRDIGIFAAKAFENPSKYIGQKINLIGDYLSGTELAGLLSDFTNGKINKHKPPPKWLMRIFAREWIPLREFFERTGRPPYPPKTFEAIDQCKQLHPGILSFSDYIRQIGYKKI